jgi:hypothetical protein
LQLGGLSWQCSSVSEAGINRRFGRGLPTSVSFGEDSGAGEPMWDQLPRSKRQGSRRPSNPMVPATQSLIEGVAQYGRFSIGIMKNGPPFSRLFLLGYFAIS